MNSYKKVLSKNSLKALRITLNCKEMIKIITKVCQILKTCSKYIIFFQKTIAKFKKSR